MAGSDSDFSLPNSSFFNIYSDGGPVARTSPAPSLPGGQCNFVDLSQGANGPKCGCRRFWSRGASGYLGNPSGQPNESYAGSQADQAAFCMCSHHACYHDEGQGPFVAPPPPVMPTTSGQENERPKSNREPLTPVMPELSFAMPPPSQPVDFHTFNHASFSANIHKDIMPVPEVDNTVSAPLPTASAHAHAPEASIPDTLSWTNLIQSQPDDHQVDVLPSIPSQCLLPASQPSSTTSSARIAYLKPFGGRGLNTLNGARSKLREPLDINSDGRAPAHDDDAADHSIEPSVDDLTVTNTPRSTRSARRIDPVDRPSQPGTIGPSREDFRELSDTVQSHDQRLEKLETVSFDNDHEDCHEQHDRADLRITDLEVRVEELEKALNDGGSVVASMSRPRRPGVDESTASVVSVATNTSSRTDRGELRNELQAVKSQLSRLQASSFTHLTQPWEVEVVFLPFPLKGIWFESREFPSQRLSGSAPHIDADQWTQLPSSSSPMEPPSPEGIYEWNGPELESEWLLARACAPDKMIDQRLRSRGLIKTVMVRDGDARSVQHAVSTAFGTLFRTFSRMQANVYHGSSAHHRVAKFFGLQQPWVPLRKIHKDSRLRFLSPAEMVTPTLWDVSFLSSSVVMKATGMHRLFITQPEAYLQDVDAYDNGWSWQRLRELSRVYPDSQSSQQEVPEADAMEDCWAWNDKLDEQPSSQSSAVSLSLRQAAQPRLKSVTPTQHQLLMSRSGVSPSLSTGRSRAGSPMVLKERKHSIHRPPQIRTTSMPPSLPPAISPAPPRRRISTTTFGNVYSYHERRASPQLLRASTGSSRALAKEIRRRSTRSPSVPLSARLRNTPRWSSPSISPLPEAFAITNEAGVACRQTTPFFYATPYSNAPLVDARQYRGPMDADEDHGSGTDYSVEDAPESEDDSDDNEGDSQMVDLGHTSTVTGSDDGGPADAQNVAPEDDPWPGIEDEENRDPEALAFDSIDVYVDDDAMTDATDDADGNDDMDSQKSSVPSEYPSTHRAWAGEVQAAEFRVYEDLNNAAGQRSDAK